MTETIETLKAVRADITIPALAKDEVWHVKLRLSRRRLLDALIEQEEKEYVDNLEVEAYDSIFLQDRIDTLKEELTCLRECSG